MSFSKRLYNIARAEVRSAAGKVRDAASGLLGGRDDDDEGEGDEAEPEVREVKAGGPTTARTGARRPTVGVKGASGLGEEPEHVRRFYANLELPIGAGSLEVKAAYRRLMRRYHPDLHQASGENARVATELAQELRVAYEGLLAYLGPRGR